MRYTIAVLVPGLLFLSGTVASAQKGDDDKAEISDDIKHDVSRPLRDIIAPPGDFKPEHEKKLGRIPVPPSTGQRDPVVQTSAGVRVAATAGLGFNGVGNGFSGPNGSFFVNAAPPDTNGAVGAAQFVQWVNESFAVFDKSTGTVLMGPTAGNALWQGFGGGCETNNDGDPIVQYDKAAARWVFTQFSVSATPYLQCVAVSTSSDATGTYYRYAFSQPNFPDYPKLGVWPDAYYVTFNMFGGASLSFAGARACAFDRAKMLAGAAATQICFQKSTSVASLLPSDLDGLTAPPSGAPNFLVNFGTNSLNLFKFHVDFVTPANSTFTGPTSIPVAAFTPACNGGGTCIPQPGVSTQLDSLADRLMYRLAYRNFGDHEALVVNHSVAAGGSVGVRWYEVRSPSTAPSVFQQGTYAPDANYRWMGSIGMDHVGNIALGYSVSSGSTYPSIRFTGRLPGDALGTLGAESSILAGNGSQNGNLTRWGDYSSISIDPIDDCTFWYTNQYLPYTGSFNWSTRIASFKMSGCGTSPDFSISAAPTSQTVKQGVGTSYTVNVNALNGFTGTVGLSVTGVPTGATATLNQNSITNSGSTTLTVTTSPTMTLGTYTLTITGSSGSLSHSTTVTLVVTSANSPDFSISAAPSSQTVRRGSNTSYSVTVGQINGFSGTVAFSVSGLPSRASASFNPSSVTGSGTSTLAVHASSRTPTGTYTLTIKGTNGSLTHSTTVKLTVQ